VRLCTQSRPSYQSSSRSVAYSKLNGRVWQGSTVFDRFFTSLVRGKLSARICPLKPPLDYRMLLVTYFRALYCCLVQWVFTEEKKRGEESKLPIFLEAHHHVDFNLCAHSHVVLLVDSSLSAIATSFWGNAFCEGRRHPAANQNLSKLLQLCPYPIQTPGSYCGFVF
jgi:hypothetical protein